MTLDLETLQVAEGDRRWMDPANRARYLHSPHTSHLEDDVRVILPIVRCPRCGCRLRIEDGTHCVRCRKILEADRQERCMRCRRLSFLASVAGVCSRCMDSRKFDASRHEPRRIT